MQHYGGKGRAWLKLLSKVNLWIDIFLLFLPFYFPRLFDLIVLLFQMNIHSDSRHVIHLAGRIVGGLIAGRSAIGLVREFLLSKTQIVKADFTKDLIRELITLLMDQYGWKGSCRVSIFRPEKERILIYDRITSGHGPGDFALGQAFFTMGKGIPGKAWKHAWSGDDFLSLIDALQIANIPGDAIRDKESLRKYFRDEFGIDDDKIFDSLGPKKMKIKCYMAIGILGRFQKLGCVLVIDSEDENQFVDFEQLKRVRSGRLTEERGLAIMGQGRQDHKGVEPNSQELAGGGIDLIDLPFPIPKGLEELWPQIKKKFKDTGDWQKAKDIVKQITIFGHVAHSKEILVPAPAFLFALGWVMKQLRDIFIMEE